MQSIQRFAKERRRCAVPFLMENDRLDMKRTQLLSSGVTIQQDFADAIRPVFYQTEYDEFLYATDEATLFLVRVRGRDYGVTCRHVFTGQGFEPSRRFITQGKQAKKGSLTAPIQCVAYPAS